MALKLNEEHVEAVRRHGSREYPSECCGVLLGVADGAQKEVREVVSLRNLRQDPRRAQELLPVADLGRESERNRYLVDPKEQIRVEKDARARGLEVLGYYHSHPDHPARPSNYDREHAWPWYSYIIVSIEGGKARDLTCWVLSDDRSRFSPEQIEVLSN